MTYEEWHAEGKQIQAELDRVDAEWQEAGLRLKLSKHKGDEVAVAKLEEDRNQFIQEWGHLVRMLKDHKKVRLSKV